jgi:2-polyprenyl-6-hydroxyphenyl methylase / 3-demethylubiquinone-9 3-methyltransferase
MERDVINNQFYDELEEDWYQRQDHPIALLRAEHKVRTPWMLRLLTPRSRVLDIGCGAGLLSNVLAKHQHQVTGIDLSEKSLHIAQKYDDTSSVQYLQANAYSLPFSNGSFDAVCALDILEHVEEPQLLISEAARVLKPKGLFFFHTFNRTLRSYLLVIKGVEWCIDNAPKNMHVYPLFLKPKELEALCEQHKLTVLTFRGLRPCFTKSFWQILFTRRIAKDCSFRFCHSLATGYCGYARKRGRLSLY